jgi:hypothetical protein
VEIQYRSLGLVCAFDRQWAFGLIDLGTIGVLGIRLGPLCVFLAIERDSGAKSLPGQWPRWIRGDLRERRQQGRRRRRGGA